MTTNTLPQDVKQTQLEIEARIRPYLQQYPLYNTVIEIVEGTAHLEDGWWYVPVRLNTDEPRTYQYYDTLVEIEDEIAQQERLRVMLVPAG